LGVLVLSSLDLRFSMCCIECALFFGADVVSSRCVGQDPPVGSKVGCAVHHT